jgi:hypothetical protein
MKTKISAVAWGLCLALWAVPGVGRAQIVNVQPLFTAEDHPGFAGQLEASADWRTGNVRFLLVSGNASVRYRGGDNLLLAYVRGELGLQGGNQFVGRTFEHLRYRRRLVDWLQLEGFVQHDRDNFRRLALRMLAGAGPRVTFVQSKSWDLSLGVAYMAEYELLREGDFPDSGLELLNHRLSAYIVSSLKVNELLRFGFTLYAQPRLDDPRDLRSLVELDLRVSITTHFGIKLTFSAAYDSQPPAGLQPLDTALKSSVQFGF